VLNVSSTNIPDPRTGASVFYYGTSLIAFGGYCSTTGYYNDVHRLDTSQPTLQWTVDTSTGVAPTPRASAVAFVQGNTLYVFGGLTATGTASDTYTYDLVGKVWTVVTGLSEAPPARAFASSVALQNRALVVGGSADGGEPYSDTWQFVLQNQCIGLSCEDCTKNGPTAGCGWCNGNTGQYRCIAGDTTPYVPSTCVNSYTADIDQCPEAFPSYAIALIVIGGVVLVGIIIFAIMKVRSSKSDYQEIS
jgi:hypothetical protein